jgi:hypothetical protein
MRLICFGDSWTAGHGVESDEKYKEDAHPNLFIQKLREQNSWPKWLSFKLNAPFINNGVCGYGNEYILKDLKECFEKKYINSEDVVIVMFSYPYRYKTKDTHNVVEIFLEMEELLVNNEHYYFNSFYPSFKEEDVDIEKLPSYFINPSGCVSDILREYEINNDVGVWEYGSRSVWNDEKNFYEGDYHPNLLGYKIIGDYIYDEINKHGK